MMDRPRRGSADNTARPRSLAFLLVLAVCGALAFSGFVALGTWQVYRLQWKRALIERVDQRVHAPATAAPGPERWPDISAESDEYRHVYVTGRFLYSLTARVQAATELGSGFWLVTPLRSGNGTIVLVNRGFVPVGAPREEKPDADTETETVTGLLRISEPGGGFLRNNDPAHDRWYSRDVQAIADARGLHDVAPYFIDAQASPTQGATASSDGAPAGPVPGLTVISFHNNHLVYAITWYALALMVLGAVLWTAREERRIRRRPDGQARGIERNDERDRKK